MGPTTEAETTTELKAEANAKTCRHKDQKQKPKLKQPHNRPKENNSKPKQAPNVKAKADRHKD